MGGTIIPMTTPNITYRNSFHIVSFQTARATCLCHGVLVIFMPSLPVAECPGCWYLHTMHLAPLTSGVQFDDPHDSDTRGSKP